MPKPKTDAQPGDAFSAKRTAGTIFAENLLAATLKRVDPATGELVMLKPPPIRRVERVIVVEPETPPQADPYEAAGVPDWSGENPAEDPQ